MSAVKPALVIKTGDTFPTLVTRFEDEKGQIDLSSAETVKVYLSLVVEEGEPGLVVEGVCSIEATEEEVNGKMTKVWLAKFTFTPEDTATAGLYKVEHKATLAPGVVESLPNKDYDYIEIQPSL